MKHTLISAGKARAYPSANDRKQFLPANIPNVMNAIFDRPNATHGATTISITTLSIMPPSIMGVFATLSIKILSVIHTEYLIYCNLECH
jgi:hypothetical protein